MRSYRRLLGILAVVGLLIASCSSDSDSPTSTEGNGTSTTLAGSSTSTPTTTADTPTTTGEDPVPTTAPNGDTSITIVAPAPLSTHLATVDMGGGVLAAEVEFRSETSGGSGAPPDVLWASDLDGVLGTGLVLTALLTNNDADVASHQVTATAVWPDGESTTATIDVVVKVPSN